MSERTVLSPNYTKRGWLYGPPVAVFIHSTRSGLADRVGLAGHAKELESTINWFLNRASNSSAQWVISPTERVRMVPDEFPSWHAKEHSFQAYAIELTQPVVTTPYEEGHYENLVTVCRPYVEQGIQILRLPTFRWGQTEGGFIGHEDSAQGLRDGKSDPGPPFNWPYFLTKLGAAVGGDWLDQVPVLFGQRVKVKVYGAGFVVEERELTRREYIDLLMAGLVVGARG